MIFVATSAVRGGKSQSGGISEGDLQGSALFRKVQAKASRHAQLEAIRHGTLAGPSPDASHSLEAEIRASRVFDQVHHPRGFEEK